MYPPGTGRRHTGLSGAVVPLTRREFLCAGGGLAVAGFAEPGVATAGGRAAGARSCILVYLLGGPPHLDMWDLKPDAPAEVRGPFKPIATSVPGVRVCEHLPRLARLAHRYALVRSVSHNNHNHTPMIYYTLTGRPVERPAEDNDVRPPQRTDFPHFGAVSPTAGPPRGGYPATSPYQSWPCAAAPAASSSACGRCCAVAVAASSALSWTPSRSTASPARRTASPP